MKKYIFLLFVLMAGRIGFAQDNKVTNAFSNSYQLVYDKKYNEALKNFLLIYDEGSYEINLRLAYLYYLTGNYDESITYYKRSMALMPNSIEPLWAILSPLAAQEKWVEVEKAYFSILKFDPKNVTANYNLGYIYYYRKDYAKAKKYFEISMQQYPFTYNYMLMTAWSNYFLGNAAEAKSLFTKTLMFNPDDASAMEGLALLKKN